jgi:hypothetical protein
MIFTAAGASSLADSLSRWEWGEYVSEAFVIIACAGELVADLGRECVTRAHRDRILRLSTILLVAALSASLICLVRTNELSGNVIGSLGEKANLADTKAKMAIADSSTALSQAKDALTEAGKAEDSLGKAENEANKAQTSALRALTLARDARTEADSFEKDIVSAKQQAAEAESHLAEALRQAAAATEELNRLKSPRMLINASAHIPALRAYEGTEYEFVGVFSDPDSLALLRQIDILLQLARWKRVQAKIPGGERFGFEDVSILPIVYTGVLVAAESREKIETLRVLPPTSLPKNIQAAVVLKSVLGAAISPAEEDLKTKDLPVTPGDSSAVAIWIGKKP